MYDIVIVGAGPSGANLARLLPDRYRVLILDRRELDDPPKENGAAKCCGGLLAPDAQKMLARLGLGVPRDILVDPQLFAVRTIDLTNRCERLYQRYYFNLDREKFDRWLVSLIPPSVEKQFGALFTGFSKDAAGYEVRFCKGGQEFKVTARAIAAADGASSRIRRAIGSVDDQTDTYIAIQQWFRCKSPQPYFTALFDEEVTDFYSWLIPKDDHLLLGSALTPGPHAREQFERLKVKLTAQGFLLEDPIKTEGAFLFRPRRRSCLLAGKGAVALVGEAAGAISPSSAEGISYALKSSLYLAQSMEEGLEGFLGRYEEKLREIRRNILLKNLKSPVMYQPFLRNLVMKSGLRSI